MNPAGWGLVALGLFVGTVGCLEAGYRLGTRKVKNPELMHDGIGGIEAAVFALLGLLLGFSFGSGISRLEARRQLIIQEANAIGTAYLRLDTLAAGDQRELRLVFREYLDSRLRVYELLPDMNAAQRQLAHGAKIQQSIWSRAVTASRADSTQTAARLLLPAVNEMIDVTTSRTVALHTHLPSLIFALLVAVALLSALVAGYAMSKRRSRSWLHVVVYSLVIAITVYAVLDIDDPRSGLIQLQAADQALLELRDSIR
jgi:hypothetical protein